MLFASNTFKAICEMVEMVKTHTIPYDPISNGLTEKLNSTIISMIQKAVSEEEYDWDGHLSKLLMCYHSAVQQFQMYNFFIIVQCSSSSLAPNVIWSDAYERPSA